ncbi:MAG: hypothetical protein R3287_08660, partial [Anderseniella sp.]|nr:hypothetical protein [Anderseniella sp.]
MADDFTTMFPEPAPSEVIDTLTLWATHYRVHTAAHDPAGIALVDKNNLALGPKLTRRDFCEAAMQGTVTVSNDTGTATYNSYNAGRRQLADCVPFYARAIRLDRIKRSVVERLGRMRFFRTSAEYGHGVKSWHLRPFRTIAVDSSGHPIPYRSVVYIPNVRGLQVTLPNGQNITHDGYFFAADTGANIKTNHINIFGGVSTANPFPG